MAKNNGNIEAQPSGQAPMQPGNQATGMQQPKPGKQSAQQPHAGGKGGKSGVPGAAAGSQKGAPGKKGVAGAMSGKAAAGKGNKAAAGKGGKGNNSGKPAKGGQQQKSHKNRMIAIMVISLLVVVGIVVALCLVFFSNEDDFYDSNSIIGQAPYKTEEEIRAELDRKVEEGMFNISIASEITFEDGTAPGVAYIENVPGNRYVMQVDIVLDDTGETIYESGGLKPDSYIKDVRLSRDLDKGTYQATATFHALNPESLEEQGQAAAKVTLNVLN